MDVPALAPPRGFAHGTVAARGSLLRIAAQHGTDADGVLVSDDFAEQFDRALGNVIDVVTAAGGTPRDLVRITCFTTDLAGYHAAGRRLGQFWRVRLGLYFPAMAMIGVRELIVPGARVALVATAARGT